MAQAISGRIKMAAQETNRGKKCLLHDGYVYRLDAVLKNQDSSWKCSNKNCGAHVKTIHDGSTIIPVSYVKMRGSDTHALTRLTEREKHQFLMRQYNKLLSVSVVTQDNSDRTLEKTRVTRDAITVFTGMPPKDYKHIHGVKTLIESYPHPNVQSVPVEWTHTLPIGPGDVWEKMTDWHHLTPAEQNSTKNFLMERFAVEDLELAYDEFYPKHGRLPTVHDFRVFILNWEGRRRKRRSLAQMKEELESKDSNIQNLTTDQNNLRMALDHTVSISVNQQDEINNLLRDNMSLYDETEQLTNDKGRLEDDNRQLRSDNSSKDKTLEQQVRVNSYLRRNVVSMGETIEQHTAQCVELKTKNVQLCKNVKHKDGTISQLQTENTQLQTENTQKDGTISQLQTENTQKDGTISQLQTENTQKDGTISQLQTENTQKDGTISQLQTENTQLQTENTQKDGTISQLQTENTQLQTENTQLQTENTEVQVQNKKFNSETRNLKKDNMLLYQRLKETTEISEQKDRQLRIQKMKVDDLSYQMSETGDRIARLEKVSEEKCDEVNRLIGSNNEQAEHIQEQNDTIGDLRVRLREQERINRDLYSQIAELRQQVLQQIAAADHEE